MLDKRSISRRPEADIGLEQDRRTGEYRQRDLPLPRQIEVLSMVLQGKRQTASGIGELSIDPYDRPVQLPDRSPAVLVAQLGNCHSG